MATIEFDYTEPTREPTCPSCGTPFTEHLGLIPTCQALQELRKKTLAAFDHFNNYETISIARVREILADVLD